MKKVFNTFLMFFVVVCLSVGFITPQAEEMTEESTQMTTEVPEIAEDTQAQEVTEETATTEEPSGKIEIKNAEVNEESTTESTEAPNPSTETPVNPDDGKINFTLDKDQFVYTGQSIEPKLSNVSILWGGEWKTLAEGEYQILFKDNRDTGTASVMVSTKEDSPYGVHELTKHFTITKADQKLTVKASKSKVRYGKKGKVNVSGAKGTVTFVSSDKKRLTIDGKGNYKGIKTGTVTVTVKVAGTKNYKKTSVKVKITVTGKSLNSSKTKIRLGKKSYTYNGKKRKPSVKVIYKKKALKRGKDYLVSYENNIKPGKAKVVIRGIGHYEGVKKKSFTINKKNNPVKISLTSNHVDIKKTTKIKVKKAVGKVTFKSSNEKIAVVSDKGIITGKAQGTCTITIRVAGDATRKSVKKEFKIQVGYFSLKDSACKIILDKTKYVYNGQTITPKVTVKYNKTTLKEKTDYTVEFKDNLDAGKATVTVKGKGKYKDSKKQTFTISKADQIDFSVTPLDKETKVGETFTITTSNAKGSVKFKSNSPSYLQDLGNGKFKALKKTVNYVSVTVTATGDKNYKSKDITVYVHIH